MEQIANIVGIKAPSLYKHYKGKEDILNALIDSAEVRYEEMFGSLWDLFPIILVHDLVRRGE
jgi:AcrR family transcriptional regulator